jgi:hypothetical protein
MGDDDGVGRAERHGLPHQKPSALARHENTGIDQNMQAAELGPADDLLQQRSTVRAGMGVSC